MIDYLKWIDYGRVIDGMMKLTTESNTIIRLAIDSFPYDLRSDWSTGIYALSYHEPDIIPESLRRKNVFIGDARVSAVHHEPGTPDDMLTMLYLEALQYLHYTVDMISRLSDGHQPYRVIRCTCRSQRWIDQLLKLRDNVNADPIPERTLPISFIIRLMTSFERFGIICNFGLERGERWLIRYDGSYFQP